MFTSDATQLFLKRRIPKGGTKTSLSKTNFNLKTQLSFVLYPRKIVFINAHDRHYDDGRYKYKMPVCPGKDFSQEELLQPGKYTGTNDM